MAERRSRSWMRMSELNDLGAHGTRFTSAKRSESSSSLPPPHLPPLPPPPSSSRSSSPPSTAMHAISRVPKLPLRTALRATAASGSRAASRPSNVVAVRALYSASAQSDRVRR